jgi:hypothetical protein
LRRVNFKNKPLWYNTKKVEAYNCGIVGMNRLDLLEEWWESALQHVNYLKKHNGYPDISSLTCLTYEQQYVGCLCDYYNYSVGLLTDYGTDKNQEYITEDLAIELGYTHLLSDSKRRPEIERKVSNRLAKEKIHLV